MTSKPKNKEHLTHAQCALALSLLTDVINESRAAVTFTVYDGKLVEISSGKTLLEEHPGKKRRKPRIKKQDHHG